MANVLFKRGLQANLDNTTIEDGVFYLTTDTNRLYVGQGNTKKLLNQTIQIVSEIDELRTVSSGWSTTAQQSHINDIYYITGGNANSEASNILAIWNGSNWVQINPDTNTEISSFSSEISDTTNKATVSLNINDGRVDTNVIEALSTSFAIEGTGTIQVSSNTATNSVVIGSQPYSLATDVHSTSTTSVQAQLMVGGTAVSALTFNAPNDSTARFQSTGTAINVITTDTKITNASLEFGANPGQIDLTLTDNTLAEITASITGVGVIIGASSTHYLPIESTSGKTAGSVYTKAEVDNIIKGLNSITYRGGASNSQPLPTTQVQIGDMYIITETGITGVNNAMFHNATVDNITSNLLITPGTMAGDMVIAQSAGSEGSDTYIDSDDIIWLYVPSGNDSLTAVTYSADFDDTNNVFGIKNGANVAIASHALVAGNDVVISSTADGAVLTSTISHEAFATTATTASSLSHLTESFTAIKGLTIDNGHVTGYELDTFTPIGYQLTDAAVTNSASATGVTLSLELTTNDNDVSGLHATSAAFNIDSSSLAIRKGSGDTDVTINLEWGTF